MTHNTFAFWFCTPFSGIIIGIASQRIPEAWAKEEIKPRSYEDYASVCKACNFKRKSG